MTNPFEAATSAYAQVRPAYPVGALDVLASKVDGIDEPHVVDLGAGTGKMTQLLAQRGWHTMAVEPAAAMRHQIRIHPRVRIYGGTAEDTGLPSGCADMVVAAQAWHWFDALRASDEAARLLCGSGPYAQTSPQVSPPVGTSHHTYPRPSQPRTPHLDSPLIAPTQRGRSNCGGSVLAIVFNQMDVSLPWVHRLTRIMRSGDVHRADRPPLIGPQFSSLTLDVVAWSDTLSTDDVMALGRTRSSWLRQDKAGRVRMQDNLRWYLHEHLGYDSGEAVKIPYHTLIWTAHLKA
ncbi:class I SAM-dependent methyltransferase [Schaalia suimastitidis]|uniref:class I SAM-dependent methyltransferase n=1 Tax=Schaalia suimastitidis TaxID=121163 RepID=UPI000425DF52|nr:class I SAM-dependent methyltransferase [Schaalia suimastitidis]